MSVPASPLPDGMVTTTENTRLLQTATSSYQTQQQEATVISMTSAGERGIRMNGNVGSSAIRHIISSGQPSIPTHQLTEKIQDILVFTEVKKNQQERVLRNEKRQKARNTDGKVPDSSSSDSDDDGSLRQTLKKKLSEWSIEGGDQKRAVEGEPKLRKRDFAVDALRFATDKWKEKHGWEGEGSSPTLPQANETTTTTTITTLLGNLGANNEATATATVIQKQEKNIPSSAENVFDVAKNASVCAVMALLHERRQSSGHTTETDISLQSLALSTLNLGLRVHDTSASQVVLYEMLTNKWMHGKSALEWAVENNSQLILNDARVQLVIEELWKSGPNWRQDPNHPSNIWLKQPPTSPPETNRGPDESDNFAWYVTRHTFVEFLARWPSARYQALVSLFSILIYLSFHIQTVTNLDYTSDTPFLYEYIYYTMVISDFVLAYYTLATQPCIFLKRVSSYVTLLTASLLLAALVIRFFALIVVDSVSELVYFLTFSYYLVVLATPLMFFRVLTASTNLSWSTAKVSYILHACVVNSLWVFSLGIFVIVGFWVALASLQFEDVSSIDMLRYLLLGALHSPAIGETLIYQPGVAGLLLVVYLFFTVVVLGSLLTASFLATILEIYGRVHIVKRDWAIQRCVQTKPELGIFIPSLAVDLVYVFIAWVARVVFKRQERLVWLEKTHQLIWYLIYSPFILLVGLYELVTVILFRWSLVANAFKRVPINTASYK